MKIKYSSIVGILAMLALIASFVIPAKLTTTEPVSAANTEPAMLSLARDGPLSLWSLTPSTLPSPTETVAADNTHEIGFISAENIPDISSNSYGLSDGFSAPILRSTEPSIVAGAFLPALLGKDNSALVSNSGLPYLGGLTAHTDPVVSPQFASFVATSPSVMYSFDDAYAISGDALDQGFNLGLLALLVAVVACLAIGLRLKFYRRLSLFMIEAWRSIGKCNKITTLFATSRGLISTLWVGRQFQSYVHRTILDCTFYSSA